MHYNVEAPKREWLPLWRRICVFLYISVRVQVCKTTLLDFHAEAPLEGAFSGFSRGGGAILSHNSGSHTHTDTEAWKNTKKHKHIFNIQRNFSRLFVGKKNVEHSSKVQNDLSKSALMTVLRLKCGNSWYSSKLLWFSQRKTARASDMLWCPQMVFTRVAGRWCCCRCYCWKSVSIKNPTWIWGADYNADQLYL